MPLCVWSKSAYAKRINEQQSEMDPAISFSAKLTGMEYIATELDRINSRDISKQTLNVMAF